MAAPVLNRPFKEIHEEALNAAREAFTEAFARMGNKDNYPCGFAWVNVSGVKLSTKFGKEFAKLGFRKSYYGGIELWNPSGSYVQNMDVKYAGAVAYANVLRRYGISAFASERLD
jgi:hypothetical protein